MTALRGPRRHLAAGATVLLGMLALILANGFLDRTFFLFREGLIRGHVAHVQVLPNREAGMLDTDLPAGTPATRVRARRALADFPDAIVSERLSLAGLASFGERTVGFLGEGVEPDKEKTLSRAVVIDVGRALAGSAAKEVLLGEGLARSLGAGLGDAVTLLVNTKSGSIHAIEARVAGIFHSANKAYDDRAIRLPLAVAQQLTRVQGVSRLMILLPKTEQTGRAATLLRDAFHGSDVTVKTWDELADFYTKTVDLFSRQLNFVKGIILLIVMLGVFNSAARNVLERSREIGTMMALGRRASEVAREFVLESALLGVFAGALGVALGAALAWLITWVGIPMPPPPGNAHGFVGGVDFSLIGSLETFASVVAVCAIAALLPSWRVTRMSIVDSLRAT